MIRPLVLLAIGLSSSAFADHTTPAPPGPLDLAEFRRCVDMLTEGAFQGSFGLRMVYNDTRLYPRYDTQTATRICGQDTTKWQLAARCLNRMVHGVVEAGWGMRQVQSDTALYPRYRPGIAVALCANHPDDFDDRLACMNRLTGGVRSGGFGNRWVEHDTTLYPRYSQDASLYLCRYSQNRHESIACLDHLTGGIRAGGFGQRFVENPTAVSPRAPVDAAVPACTFQPNQSGRDCVRTLTRAGIDPILVGNTCGRPASEGVQACVIRFQIQSMGLYDPYLIVQICAANPSTQPADASRIANCLSGQPVGQMGATAPVLPPPGGPGMPPPYLPVPPGPHASGAGDYDLPPGS